MRIKSGGGRGLQVNKEPVMLGSWNRIEIARNRPGTRGFVLSKCVAPGCCQSAYHTAPTGQLRHGLWALGFGMLRRTRWWRGPEWLHRRGVNL